MKIFHSKVKHPGFFFNLNKGIFILIPCIGFSFLSTLCSCTFDNIKLKENKTFLRFIGENYNIVGVKGISVENGYAVLATSIRPDEDEESEDLISHLELMILDQLGGQVHKYELKSAEGVDVKYIQNMGYFILADSINSTTTQKKLILLNLNSSGELVKHKVFGMSNTVLSGDALTATESSIITLARRQVGSEKQEGILFMHNLSTLDTLWSHRVKLYNRDVNNGKSVIVTSQNEIMWIFSSRLTNSQTSQVNSYLNFPILNFQKNYENNDLYGERENYWYSGVDIQQGFIYHGVIGTRSNESGLNSNILFMQMNSYGNLVPGSIRYFDGVDIQKTDTYLSEGSTTSEAEDEAVALVHAGDGGFLLVGTMETPSTGKDIVLIRVDPFGEVIWHRRYGGSEDDNVNSVERVDEGYLLCGTHKLKELNEIFLLKITDTGDIID